MIQCTPPKTQLLKWVGNKQKFAVEIVKHFPHSYNFFYEPFLGSGAILATVAPSNGMGSDIFTPLMDIWNKLSLDPEGLVEWYKERRNLMEQIGKAEAYNVIRASYNANPNGADFLYLSRACYGGVIRFRKSDGFMSTPCDPPYSHSQSILYGAQSFQLEELFNEIDKAKARGVKVALSIDGKKKSGQYVCDLPIPPNLFEKEMYINCGGSMLKRFQLEGENLENENVLDRLLLTY